MSVSIVTGFFGFVKLGRVH